MAEWHLITTGKQTLEEVLHIFQIVRDRARDESQSVDTLLANVHLHIREKQRSAREIFSWYMSLRTLLPQVQIYINDRLDVAGAVGADGVQLAWHSLPLVEAKRLLPNKTRIGCSVHHADEAVECAANGAHFVLYGHIFETASKVGLAPRGLYALHEVVQASPVPVIALGGIQADNLASVLATGCAGVAIMSGFFYAQDPYTLLQTLQQVEQY